MGLGVTAAYGDDSVRSRLAGPPDDMTGLFICLLYTSQRISVCRMLCYFSGFLLRSQGISAILLICRNFSRSAPGRQSRAGGVTGKRSLLDVQGLRKNGVEQLVGILDGLHIGEHRQGLGLSLIHIFMI